MNSALAEYGRLIGRDDLASGHHGQACRMVWPDGSSVDIEEIEGELQVSLAFAAAHPNGSELLKALQLLDLRQAGAAAPLQVGLVGLGVDARLVVLARSVAREADGRLIQQHVERCRQWQRRWEAMCQRQAT